MFKFKIILAVFLLIIFAGCASKFAGFNMRIGGALTPKDIISLAVDIQTAGISKDEKRQLNLKLAKKTLNMAEVYIKMVIGGKKMPEKDEILSIVKALSACLNDNVDEKELTRQITEIIKSLSFMILV